MAGESSRQLAERTGLARCTILSILKRAGVQVRPTGGGTRPFSGCGGSGLIDDIAIARAIRSRSIGSRSCERIAEAAVFAAMELRRFRILHYSIYAPLGEINSQLGIWYRWRFKACRQFGLQILTSK